LEAGFARGFAPTGAANLNWLLIANLYGMTLSFLPNTGAATSIMFYHPNITPPKDPAVWTAFITAFVTYLVERYGAATVETFYFEVWNEPNGPAFWYGSQVGGARARALSLCFSLAGPPPPSR
jgi:hypothetical protein